MDNLKLQAVEVTINNNKSKELIQSNTQKTIENVNEIEESSPMNNDKSTASFNEESTNDFDNLLVNEDDLLDEDNIFSDKSMETKTNKTKSGDNFTKLAQLPLSRIKNIMKVDDDVSIVSAESVFAVTKSTELFVKLLTEQTFDQMKVQKRKTLMKKDLEQILDKNEIFSFLEGTFL